MSQPSGSPAPREGSLEAPTRHPLDWKNPTFYNEPDLFRELERVFDICHGCRRCVSLCDSFPTLFDLVDNSSTLEVDGVSKRDYWNVVDQCYLCDLCYMTKCPYVPPHEWNVDYPHLMLRAKAVKFAKGDVKLRDRILTSTDVVGNLAGIPVVAQVVNAANKSPAVRNLMEKVLGVHPDAHLPEYHHKSLRKRVKSNDTSASPVRKSAQTQGRVVLFATCYGNRNEPHIGEDLIAVFRHNGIPVTLLEQERCCGMPKLELGDLEAVERLKNDNVPRLLKWVNEGWDVVAPIPSCVLMFKQELPLMFPGDPDVQTIRSRIYDPFEYLMLRHKEGLLKTEFKATLGKVTYHVPCHLRVQNIGLKTRDALKLVPGTEVEVIERCSGHNGTYAVKSEFHDTSMKIAKPVVNRVQAAGGQYYSSDCPMAGNQIASGLNDGSQARHPMTLLRHAYGI